MDKLIIGGDLYLSLGVAKSWGTRARDDNLSILFVSKIMDKKLFGIEPSS